MTNPDGGKVVTNSDGTPYVLTDEEILQGQIDACTLRLTQDHGVLVTEIPLKIFALKKPAMVIRRMRPKPGNTTPSTDCQCCICEYLITLPECDAAFMTQLARALGNDDNRTYTRNVHARSWPEAFALALKAAASELDRAVAIACKGRIKTTGGNP
jgi:hypothetical protein